MRPTYASKYVTIPCIGQLSLDATEDLAVDLKTRMPGKVWIVAHPEDDRRLYASADAINLGSDAFHLETDHREMSLDRNSTRQVFRLTYF